MQKDKVTFPMGVRKQCYGSVRDHFQLGDGKRSYLKEASSNVRAERRELVEIRGNE